ncbi:MAG: hypothetical protein HY318_01445 [Armatimonadetes bacterium]|nr:hypothetical protein [Armatimonadota bacterium]
MIQPHTFLRSAPTLRFPGTVDCNSPAHWVGDQLYVFNSAGHPFRCSGSDLFNLGDAEKVSLSNEVQAGRWIEATWPAEDGALYAWYHKEPWGLCPGTGLTAPEIGAFRSVDNGVHCEDLGVVMEAPPNTLKCTAQNGYFAGGHGDFSVMLDRDGKWLCFFYGNYAGDVAVQGVAVARMAWADRDDPVGKVWKWHEGDWSQPALGGEVTPTFPTFIAWEQANCDSFWGPSLHWNSRLQCYVMLLNRAKGEGWKQEGVYVTFSTDLSDPTSWTIPEKIHEGGAWYPQVIGLGDDIRGSDKLAGEVARFFMQGVSDWEIVLTQEEEK